MAAMSPSSLSVRSLAGKWVQDAADSHTPENSKKPALVFNNSDSLANTIKKDVGQSHDKKFRRVHAPRRIQRSGEYIVAMAADTLANRRSSDADDGKGHPRLINQQSCVSTCGQENLCEPEQPQKMFNVATQRVSIVAHENLTPSFSFLFIYCEHLWFIFCWVFWFCAAQPYQFFGMFQLFVPCEMRLVWELLKSLFKCKLHHGWTWTKLHTRSNAPSTDLLHVTELEDAHDSIELLNFDDNLRSLLYHKKLCRYPILIKLLDNARDLFAWSVFYSADRRYHHVIVWGRHSSVRESE